MSEEYLQWYCNLNRSVADEQAEALKKEGLRVRVEAHGTGFCVAVAKDDLPKIFELEAKKHSL